MTPEKKKAIKAYLTTLGPKLRERHGERKFYTAEEVMAAILDLGLSADYACYGYMLYCSPAEFETLHAAAGEACDADVMRQSVADTFFHGNTDFNAVELADGLWGGVVHVAQTGADVTVSVVQTGAEVAVNLVSAGAGAAADAAVTVLSTGAGAVVNGVGAAAEAALGWMGDVDWGGLFSG
jgi:hypothetical protein